MDTMKIAILEPSPVIRQGIKSLLKENVTELDVIKDYCDLAAFQGNAPDSAFDIILLNPALVSFYKQFNVRNLLPDYPDAAIVAILYGYVNSETLGSFDGILDIYDDSDKIVNKLERIAKEFVNPQNGSGENIGLSEREKEILVAIAKGMTSKEIADKHYISVHTVNSHRKNITRKTGIKTVSGLTVYAMFNNLI